MTSLQKMDICACRSLLSQLDSFCDLAKLKILNIGYGDEFGGYDLDWDRDYELEDEEDEEDYCENLDLKLLYDVISKVEGLTTLSLSGHELESVPEGFGQLTNLKELSLYAFERLISLPEGILYSNGLKTQ